MILVNQSVTLVRMTISPLQHIKEMGCISYQSNSKKSPSDFVTMLIQRGHESVLEHASMSVNIITDRGISHEIVRHRIGMSYTQESTRYVKYGEIQVIRQPGLDLEALAEAEASYMRALDAGVGAGVARAMLPTCLKTQIGVTGNFRAWRHFIKLRGGKNAHPMIQEIAHHVAVLLPEPIVNGVNHAMS